MFNINWGLKCIVLLAMLGSLPSVAWSGTSVGCNDNYVLLADDELVVDIIPTGNDDTTNIQCALDFAADTGVPVVRLGRADYFISSIIVEEFNGSFQGTTAADSKLLILHQSINCDAMVNNGLTPAAIKFVRGEPRLRFMTVSGDSPCVSGELQSLVHFTGKNAFDASCKNDVIFGSVDRVALFGFERAGNILEGVTVAAEGSLLGGCKTTLLGTFKLNRSTVWGFNRGVATSMKAGAQVDINFSDFFNNAIAIDLIDSNQSTTIASNDIGSFNSDPSFTDAIGVAVTTFDANPPKNTRVVINNNAFNITDSTDNGAFAIFPGVFNGATQDVSMVVSNNKFKLNGQGVIGVLGVDVDNVAISTNAFSGVGLAGIAATNRLKTAVYNWTITANTGFAGLSSAASDLVFDVGTRNFIVGPGQSASTFDDGSGNIILSASGTASAANADWAERNNKRSPLYAFGASQPQARSKYLANGD